MARGLFDNNGQDDASKVPHDTTKVETYALITPTPTESRYDWEGVSPVGY